MPSWYVHNMNTERPSPSGADHFKSLQILDELSNNDSLTQRDLSKRLGIALGLVNSYIKNLVKKGYITVKAIPPKRFAYFLTPKGLTEKTRLTYHLLQDYTRIYREAKSNLHRIFKEMRDEGVKRVVFAGSDEIAEIAYITMQEMGIVFAGVVDEEKVGHKFFNREIKSLADIKDIDYDYVVVASYLKRETIYKGLLKQGVPKKQIRIIFSI
jgi:DNA-binding MarR family transcriptional regulator